MDISKILNQLEELIYDLFVWFLLLPKTLTKLLVDPVWAFGYIDDQLKISEQKNRFSSFLSPILLWLLLVGLTMFLYVSISMEAVKIICDSVLSILQEISSNLNKVAVNVSDTQSSNQILEVNKHILAKYSEIKENVPKIQELQWGIVYFLCSSYLFSILSTTIIVQLFQKLQVSRDAIRKNVYLQFYCYTPVHSMASIAALLVSNSQKEKAIAFTEKYKVSEPVDIWFQKLNTFDADYNNIFNVTPSNLMYFLYGITIIWFFWAEISIIKKQLGTSVLECLGILVLSLGLAIASLGLIYILLSPFLSSKLPFFT